MGTFIRGFIPVAEAAPKTRCKGRSPEDDLNKAPDECTHESGERGGDASSTLMDLYGMWPYVAIACFAAFCILAVLAGLYLLVGPGPMRSAPTAVPAAPSNRATGKTP